ncbi:peptidase [Niallia circulans]|uniref:Peptidase n=1 Tax=Niallia circulans TaxID=1397 RepID=A0A553SMM8_NIACI|nr:DUF1796 family putative cysteine peptidase [Niallia circulans]TRZ38249.1 peptidase [Niallia circulans]
MSIQDLKGTYDAIYSLGDLCLASIQLRKFNLRPFAGPLDWMASNQLSEVSRLLSNKFTGYMELHNLKATGEYSTGINSTDPYLVITDTAYNIVSSHDFRADSNTFTNFPEYTKVKEKLDRRVERMLKFFEEGERILFVRTEASFADTLQLESAISSVVKNNYQILIINHKDRQDMEKKAWPIRNVTVVEMPEYEKWTNNDDYWEALFENIAVKEVED